MTTESSLHRKSCPHNRHLKMDTKILGSLGTHIGDSAAVPGVRKQVKHLGVSQEFCSIGMGN